MEAFYVYNTTRCRIPPFSSSFVRSLKF